jgi:plasmid stabilization system protein ParE
MALKILYSRDAIRDLHTIQMYVGARSPTGALHFRDGIVALIDRLAEFPLTGVATSNDRVRVADVSRYPYRIFYTTSDDALRILHIRHTSRAPIDPDDL